MYATVIYAELGLYVFNRLTDEAEPTSMFVADCSRQAEFDADCQSVRQADANCKVVQVSKAETLSCNNDR